ncbi:MAG: hypothetical protein A4E54_00803 [Pelotomaculum sp. PtaB.Bin117]|nr:MAG: hypothetical protein A4E54_00803 [Pelotomaculum sp. PtaB.Bin117]
MDVKLVLVVLFICYAIAAERHVAHGQVEKAVGQIGFLKALHRDISLLIKLPGDPPRDAVQLHAVEPGIFHAFGHQAEEVAAAAGGLQNVAGLKAHIGKTGVHCLDNDG